MDLTIIIPVKNEATVVASMLVRLQPLRQQGTEVILVDGHSTDNTIAIAGPLVDRVLNTKAGRAAQMNEGAAKAKHHWLLFLHIDTRLPENFNVLAERWDRQSAGWGFFPVKLSGQHPFLRFVEAGMNCRSRLTRVATGDQCLFACRDIFKAVGGFPDVPLMEDVMITKRLRKTGSPLIEKSKVVTSSRRWEERGIFRTVLLMWWLRLQFFFGVPADKLVKQYYPTNH